MKKHNIFVIGSTGREHALGWKLRQSKKVGKIYFAPGNAGTEEIGESSGIDVMDFQSLIKFAKKNDIYLTAAGPDDPLAGGIVDKFEKAGLRIFGPTKDAAKIEASKVFAKEIMGKTGIPTAKYKKFSDGKLAKKYLKMQDFPIVIKASGLALGKGVVIVKNLKEAEKVIDEIMVKKIFGSAGEEIVIEEFLEGKEISIHAFCDGKTVSLFPVGQDHKPIYEGNKGPNTGGMGTLAPVPKYGKSFLDEVKKRVVMPAIEGMKKRGIIFKGCLYPGLMMTKRGLRVLEFNCRFGDPEMESYMRLLDTDIFDILEACVDGELEKINIKWKKVTACCIVLASKGYPGSYKKGEVIYGLDKYKSDKDIVVFHFGTKRVKGKVVTNGGRVIGVTAIGKNLDETLERAYKVIGEKGIYFEGMQFRRDIGRVN